MSCEEMKMLMMDCIYDEISETGRQTLQAHLVACASCSKEFKSLEQTRGVLDQWPDVDANLKLVFVQENKPILDWIRDTFQRFRITPMRVAAGFAAGCAMILLGLAAINTQITYRQGDFQIRTSLWSRPAETPSDVITLTHQQWLQLQQSQLQQMEEVILQSESRQRQLLTQAVQRLAKNIDQQRKKDLTLVAEGLQQIDYATAYRFAETDRALNEMLQYALRDQQATP